MRFKVFAFGSYSKGQLANRAAEWAAKNVTPILYRERAHHQLLHRTLQAWAETYRDGSTGKGRIIVDLAGLRPAASTDEDNFVGRVLWALSDKEALPCRKFANLTPVPSLDWLEPLSEARFNHDDLVRFGVSPSRKRDDKLSFSFVSRPSPYELAPKMSLAPGSFQGPAWDERMFEIANWLLRHLGDPALILWLAEQGGRVHHQLAHMAERQFATITKLQKEGNAVQIDNLKAGAPYAIPSPAMRTLWSLLLSNRVRTSTENYDLYEWRKRFARDGMSFAVRLELRSALSPMVVLSKKWGEETIIEDAQVPSDLLECDVELSADHIDTALEGFRNSEPWVASLPDLHEDFVQLLQDTLDLHRELGKADSLSDLSYVHRPSIAEHPQNSGFKDWTELIPLVRDSWLLRVAREPEYGRRSVLRWLQTPYPLFKRLAFFAVSTTEELQPSLAAECLLTDGSWWLWSVETQREALRLLVETSTVLSGRELAAVENAILEGPPSAMFRSDIEPDRLQRAVDRETWLRLSKMRMAGVPLSEFASDRLRVLQATYPEWTLALDESDEFPVWSGASEGFQRTVTTPRLRDDLVAWLREHPSEDFWVQDDWRQRCTDDFATTATALLQLSVDNEWPTDRWRVALQAWSEERLQQLSWKHFHAVLSTAPHPVLQSLAHQISWWLQSIAKKFEGDEASFIILCTRMLEIGEDEGESQSPNEEPDRVFRAINHPVGHATEAMLKWWYRGTLKDDLGLPVEVARFFSLVCTGRSHSLRYGLLVLASNVITLFRVDKPWSERYLLPKFSWNAMPDALYVWDGYLSAPRIFMPLLAAIKQAFLELPAHLHQLGQHRQQYAALLTFVALDRGEVFSVSELRTATQQLPPSGLVQAVQALVRALESSGEQRGEYWTNRVVPYLRTIWPKAIEITPGLSAALARLCLAADTGFETALSLLGQALRPLPHPDYEIDLLARSQLCQRYPELALVFMDSIMAGEQGWPPSALRQCLDEVSQTSPGLAGDARYRRLDEYLRRFER